jgi:hypothetical protein
MESKAVNVLWIGELVPGEEVYNSFQQPSMVGE